METAKNLMFLVIFLFVFGIGFMVFHYVAGQISTNLQNANVIKDNEVAKQAIEDSTALRERFDWIVLIVYMALAMFSFLVAYFAGGNPVLMFIMFIFMIILIPIAAVLSNTWETVSQLSVFGTTLSSFPITNNLALRQPIYITVISFIDLVIMYVSSKSRALY